MSRRRRAAVNAVNNIPMMNADIVTGVSLCLLFVVFFNGWGAFAGWMNSWQSLVVLPERLTMGFGTLLIAHICFNIPYVILSVGPKLRQMDRNLIDAAQDLGCTWMQAFWRVVIPEIKPGIVSGALTAFTMSVDDFIISYFTAGTSSSTLAMTIYGMTKKRVSPEINAISTLLFVTVLVLLAVVNLRESRACISSFCQESYVQKSSCRNEKTADTLLLTAIETGAGSSSGSSSVQRRKRELLSSGREEREPICSSVQRKTRCAVAAEPV